MANTDKFELMAQGYDTPERVKIAKRSADAIREYLVGSESKSAIDFGCGTGLVGMELLDAFASMLFLDSSQGMIDQIKQKIARLHIGNAATLCVDLEKETHLQQHADYIIMVQVLLHIQDVEAMLSKLYTVLHQGGHLLIVDFNKNEQVVSGLVHNGFDQTALAGMLAKIGYRKVESKTFYSGKNLFMGQDASMFVLDAFK